GRPANGFCQSFGAFLRKTERAPSTGTQKSGARRQRSRSRDRVAGEIETEQLRLQIANCGLQIESKQVSSICNLKSAICDSLGGFDGPEIGRGPEGAPRIGQGKRLSDLRPSQ